MFASRNRVISYRHRGLTCALALTLGIFATAVHAQKYVTIPVKLDTKEISRLRLAFTAALRNPAGFAANQQDVDDFLKKAFFPQMTGTTPELLGELSDSRGNLFKSIAQAANPGAQQYLIDTTFVYAQGMARGNFHPSVRYNAVLMLGQLDQQLPTATAPPVPHPKATQELLELVEKDNFKNIPVPESVKLGALIGLERHARYGIPPQLVERFTKALLGVMASKTPEDVDADVHDWVRSSAAVALANHYAKAPTKEVQAALTALIADQKMELDDRCATAGAMRKITYAAGADIDGNATADALGQLTLDVITNAAKLAEDFNKEAMRTTDFSSLGSGRGGEYGGRGYGGGRGEYGGGRGGYGGSDDEEQAPQFERRQLFAQLYNIGVGSNSLKAGLADDSKARMEELIAALGPVMQTMDDPKAAEVDVTREVLALQATLKTLIEGWGKPVAANDKPAEGLATK